MSVANISSDSNQLRQKLGPTLQNLENQRLEEKRKLDTAGLWCLGVGAGCTILALLFGMATHNLQLWFFAPLILIAVIYAVYWNSCQSSYKASFKMLVMPELVAQFGALQYYPQSGLGEEDFNVSNLFERPDRYSSEDLIEGQIGATRLRFSEIHAQRREQRTDSKGNTSTHYVTFFRGLFFIADFNKQFNGITYVLPEGVTGLLGGLGASLQSLGGKLSGRGQLVKLEDPDFERQFQALSSDQIEARYILSSALMRRFLDLKSTHNCNVHAAFMGGSVYLAIETNANWFESPSLSTPLNFEAMGQVLHQLQSATGVVEALDLNTRIWTKE